MNENVFVKFFLVIGLMLFAIDCITRQSPTVRRQYHKILSAMWRMVTRLFRWLGHVISRFATWTWRNYKQFLCGVATGIIITTLYYTGRFR